VPPRSLVFFSELNRPRAFERRTCWWLEGFRRNVRHQPAGGLGPRSHGPAADFAQGGRSIQQFTFGVPAACAAPAGARGADYDVFPGNISLNTQRRKEEKREISRDTSVIQRPRGTGVMQQ